MQLIPGAFAGMLTLAMIVALPLGMHDTFEIEKGAALFFGYLCALAILVRNMPRDDVDAKREFEYHFGAVVLLFAGIGTYLIASYNGPGGAMYEWHTVASHVSLVGACVASYLAGLRGLVRQSYEGIN